MTSVRRAATALVCAAVTLTAVACSSSKKSADPASMTQVRELLVRHTQAVLAHSAAAFLADVDTSAAAGGFRARQAAQIASLSGVPFSSWDYAVDAQVNDPAATDVASSRYGVPALLVRVAVSFRLRGVDTTSSTHDVWWTFVRRSGRTVIAGDDDLAGSGGTSWRAPWDFGKVVAARGTSSMALGHPDSAASLPGIVKAVDAAIPAVTDVVGAAWARRVAVFVPSSAAEFSVLSNGVSSSDTAAVTIFDDPGQSRLARVVVRPDVLKTLTPLGLQIVLRHEVTHVATASVTSPITPRWLIEGLAEYVGNRDSGQPVAVVAAELASAVRAGTLPSALPPDADFGATGTALERVYEESWLACALIADRVGPKGLADLYAAVSRSAAPNDTAFGVVVRQRLGMSLTEFVAQWRAYLQTELG